MTFALITGASKGLGKTLAEELAKRRYNLLLVARSGDLLKEFSDELQGKYGVVVQHLACDLSQSGTAFKIKSWVSDLNAEVSILINNAGYGLWGYFDYLNIDDQLNMMTLNMNALVELTYAFIPELNKRPRAFILNVASTAAYQAVPTLTLYAATKSFVISFSRGLKYELRKSNISVSCLSPGSTDTNFIDRAGMGALKETAAKFSMKPERVAKIAIKGMFNKKAEIIPGFLNYVSVQFTYWFPKRIIEKIAAGLYEGKMSR